MNALGSDLPIMEGVDALLSDLQEADDGRLLHKADLAPGQDEEDAVTSDEEREPPGQRRPKKGEGWYGSGQPLTTLRKGLCKGL